MLPAAYRYRVDSLRRLIAAFDVEIDATAPADPGPAARTIPAMPRCRPFPVSGRSWARCSSPRSATCTRFARPEQLAVWAGLTPKHYESDTTVHRGRITKQGSRLVRWAAVEAVQRTGQAPGSGTVRDRIAARRGRNIATVAAARELVEMVFYALRDHHVRRLSRPVGGMIMQSRGRRGSYLS